MFLHYDRIDPSIPEESFICADCIGEEYLKAKIERDSNLAICSYCGEVGRVIALSELADCLETVFEEHFQRTSTEPSNYEYALLRDKEIDYVWERSGEPVAWIIAETAEIDNALAEHLQQVLKYRHFDFEDEKMGEENPFAEDAYYEARSPDDYEFRTDWDSCQKRLKTETRFFNRELESFLDLIFEDPTEYTTHNTSSVIIDAGPDQRIDKILRARVFQSDDMLHEALCRPDQEIGPPPFSDAVGGRMNAKGISVFYGATDSDVALAEVRPPVGSRVVVACFEIVRPLRLLNVEALRQSIYEHVHGSVFDPSYIQRLEKALFLKRLSKQITMPVMPEDEAADYLVTQAIADYLAGRTEPVIDGIIYRPIQNGAKGFNIALFQKSSRIDIKFRDTDTTIPQLDDLSDDGIPGYFVWEEVPEESAEKKGEDARFSLADSLDLDFLDPRSDFDSRSPTLKVDVTTLTVHHIKSIYVETESFPVSWDRMPKRISKATE